MNDKQLQAATANMIEWLEHPAELGKKPAKIECAGMFDCDDETFYIFKYKKDFFGDYLLGVSGGYEADSLEPSGLTFSEMEPFHAKTAEGDARTLVERVAGFWESQAAELERRLSEDAEPTTFVDFVLLKEPVWDETALLRVLKEDWGIENETKDVENAEIAQRTEGAKEAIVLSWRGVVIAVALMPAPIPNDEAPTAAATNYLWPDAVRETEKHRAHLIVSVLNECPAFENREENVVAGITAKDCVVVLVKVLAACCKAFEAQTIGVYSNSVVYEPKVYCETAIDATKEGGFPAFNMFWLGLARGEKGTDGYTFGLKRLGYDEIEIVDSRAEAEEITDLLEGVAQYVVMNNVVLHAGETIGFSAEQRLRVTKSPGVALEEETLKIDF